jgi:hypothetical protein
MDHVVDSAQGHLSLGIRSWFTGVNLNVDGRQKQRLVRYFGSSVEFRNRCDAEAQSHYAGLRLL